ncbi:hypothetical protein [Saccharothrix algeriensis]|uniref:Uncharacterized protein n=1 Tax=Saccharothrix algeriensis TaxID=173560 RepID=A0A8T8HYK5_9PSEU|nr:hypothetical protein [Saccharothrix algeriensis]MBM7815283.1 hypothetical protein [Saccharothrix algeriensis]QTR03491.1 hypothetical protein J7S33_32215 [Saccharothrix algeriensis]
MTIGCPSCGWPSSEHAYPASRHGRVCYVRCVCGLWLVLEGDRVVATAGGGPASDRVPSP